MSELRPNGLRFDLQPDTDAVRVPIFTKFSLYDEVAFEVEVLLYAVLVDLVFVVVAEVVDAERRFRLAVSVRR